MRKVYFLTGRPRVGKTTVLKQIIASIGTEHCGGFYTEEIVAGEETQIQNRRVGFRLVTLDGQSGLFAHVKSESLLRIGRYGVNLDCLETLGLTAIEEAKSAGKLLVLDEIGPMQALSDRFRQVCMELLSQTFALLGTIAWEPHPWLDHIKKHEHVTLRTVEENNRKSVVDELINTLARDLQKPNGAIADCNNQGR